MTMMIETKRVVAIFLALFLVFNPFSLLNFQEVQATSITIVDYDMEGIAGGTTQFFVIWIRGMNSLQLEINITALEFEGSTGWPELTISIYNYTDFSYNYEYITTCGTENNYTCRCVFEGTGQTKYVTAVRNLDPVDNAVYNITFSSIDEIDFQYTNLFNLEDVDDPKDNTVSITYFESTSPYLYRLESSGDTRVVVEFLPYSMTDEFYFMIYNKGNTCELFVALLGIPYLELYPSITGFIIDFEDYGVEDKEVLYLWTISNYSCGGYFTCESEHRYNFWIDLGYYRPDLYVIFDTFGDEEINFETDLFAENPDGIISVRFSFTDPWLEYEQIRRETFYWILGVGGTSVSILMFSIWYYRRRYH